MRFVTITRKKSFFGMLIPYNVFVGYLRKKPNPEDPDDIWLFPEDAVIKIANGKTVTFPLREEKCAIVVWAITSTGAAGGPAYHIDEGTTDITLELNTQYSWLNGSCYLLRPISADKSIGV